MSTKDIIALENELELQEQEDWVESIYDNYAERFVREYLPDEKEWD